MVEIPFEQYSCKKVYIYIYIFFFFKVKVCVCARARACDCLPSISLMGMFKKRKHCWFLVCSGNNTTMKLLTFLFTKRNCLSNVFEQWLCKAYESMSVMYIFIVWFFDWVSNVKMNILWNVFLVSLLLSCVSLLAWSVCFLLTPILIIFLSKNDWLVFSVKLRTLFNQEYTMHM